MLQGRLVKTVRKTVVETVQMEKYVTKSMDNVVLGVWSDGKVTYVIKVHVYLCKYCLPIRYNLIKMNRIYVYTCSFNFKLFLSKALCTVHLM